MVGWSSQATGKAWSSSILARACSRDLRLIHDGRDAVGRTMDGVPTLV